MISKEPTHKFLTHSGIGSVAYLVHTIYTDETVFSEFENGRLYSVNVGIKEGDWIPCMEANYLGNVSYGKVHLLRGEFK